MFIIEILYASFKLFIEMSAYIFFGLIFVGLLNMFISKDMVLKHVGKKNIWSAVKASLFGVPLPLCSCGVIPTAVYMAKNGASKGSVVSFLISTPQTGIDSIIATYGMMGPIFAAFRPIAALIMGIAGGTVTSLFDKNESMFENNQPVKDSCQDSCETEKPANPSLKERFKTSLRYSFVEFIDDIAGQFIVGLFIAGLITYLIPDGYFAKTEVTGGIIGMLIMIAIGAPMYICATASIPIALTLMMKGFSPGTAFVFLAVGPATNAASLAIISKSLGKKTASIYLGMIALLSIVFGYILDWIFLSNGINPMYAMQHHEHGSGMLPEYIQIIFAVIFSLLLAGSFYRKFISKYINKKGKAKMENSKTIIKIEGMSCNHCVMSVQKTLSAVDGVTKAEVSLNDKSAYLEGDFSLAEAEKAIESIGYEVVK